MKVLPEKKRTKDKSESDLTKTQATMHKISLLVVFVGVFMFFFKILFF